MVSRLEDAARLDRAVKPVQKAARRLRPGRVRDVLHGVWLGHPVHPMLVQAVIGSWASAGILDLWPGDGRGARRLVGFGLIASAPAVLAGTADWSEQHEQQMRVGLVHALANLSAVGLYSASLAAHARSLSRTLRYAGLAAVGIGGLLGGHISFRQPGGANHAESVPHLVEPDWHELVAIDELPEGRPVRRLLGEVPLLVVREEESVWVLADRCSHLSGPLSDGAIEDDCVTCPWHGSGFRLRDGVVIRGPAAAPQPAFETTVVDGRLHVRLPGAG
ncbi:Rieske 2Fe-2S domain-containing protein [Actinoallomurus acaciae]|uniref:Rieske 2Fe-2S domain-containing protein n=1 Tax=Actinoallomurus acaciae TaxID=502577 RepID=A0ABV5Y953_9ACTN